MGLFWCKKRQLTPSSDVYAAMFYEFISSLFPVLSSDTTLHNSRRFARIHAVSRWDCQSIFTPTKEKFSRKMKLKCRFYEEKRISGCSSQRRQRGEAKEEMKLKIYFATKLKRFMGFMACDLQSYSFFLPLIQSIVLRNLYTQKTRTFQLCEEETVAMTSLCGFVSLADSKIS